MNSNDEEERGNQPFDAMACKGAVPGHCVMIRINKDDKNENQIEFVYIGPIAHCPIDPAGLTVVMHPDDMAMMAMVERSKLKKVN